MSRSVLWLTSVGVILFLAFLATIFWRFESSSYNPSLDAEIQFARSVTAFESTIQLQGYYGPQPADLGEEELQQQFDDYSSECQNDSEFLKDQPINAEGNNLTRNVVVFNVLPNDTNPVCVTERQTRRLEEVDITVRQVHQEVEQFPAPVSGETVTVYPWWVELSVTYKRPAWDRVQAQLPSIFLTLFGAVLGLLLAFFLSPPSTSRRRRSRTTRASPGQVQTEAAPPPQANSSA